MIIPGSDRHKPLHHQILSFFERKRVRGLMEENSKWLEVSDPTAAMGNGEGRPQDGEQGSPQDSQHPPAHAPLLVDGVGPQDPPTIGLKMARARMKPVTQCQMFTTLGIQRKRCPRGRLCRLEMVMLEKDCQASAPWRSCRWR